jgi:hypothetical protein
VPRILHIVRGTYSGYLFLRVRTEVASRYPPLGEEDPRLYNPTSQNAVNAKFAECIIERLSGNCAGKVMFAYALRYGEQEIPYGFVR